MSSVDERVKRGANKLTGYFGSDHWAEKVNIFKLDMADELECVLGQVFGDYETGLAALWGRRYVSPGEPAEHGFNGRDDIDDSKLKIAWVQKVNELKGKARPGDRVRITFETTMPDELGYPLMTVNPRSPETKVEVLQRAVYPKPGDRVIRTAGTVRGTVVTPKPGTRDVNVWVKWDGSNEINQYYGPLLKVVSPEYYTSPFDGLVTVSAVL